MSDWDAVSNIESPPNPNKSWETWGGEALESGLGNPVLGKFKEPEVSKYKEDRDSKHQTSTKKGRDWNYEEPQSRSRSRDKGKHALEENKRPHSVKINALSQTLQKRGEERIPKQNGVGRGDLTACHSRIQDILFSLNKLESFYIPFSPSPSSSSQLHTPPPEVISSPLLHALEDSNEKAASIRESQELLFPNQQKMSTVPRVSCNIEYPLHHSGVMSHVVEKIKHKTTPKPLLVLDLDETLVSAVQVTNEERLEGEMRELLFEEFTPRQRLFLKIRPNATWFIKEMSPYFNIIIYSLGNKKYVQSIIKIIDPEGIYINKEGCYFPTDEERGRREKFLKKIRQSNAEYFTVILDDMIPVWNKDGLSNVVISKKYIPFKHRIQSIKYNRVSLEGKEEDELDIENISLYEEKHEHPENKRQLIHLADSLKKVADSYMIRRKMHPNERQKWDMRIVLRDKWRKVLSGKNVRVVTEVTFNF